MFVLGFAEGTVQLVPDGTIFIHIALILLMIWVLNRTFFSPIHRVIKSRERNKGGNSSESAGILAQVDEKTKTYESAMREARLEGYQLIEKRRVEATAKRQSEIEAVKSEMSQTISQEKDAIEKQTVEVRSALAADAQKMAEKITSNILRA